MQRLSASLVIALGCHTLLLITPIRQHQTNQSFHPRPEGITVGFSRIEPKTTQKEVKSIPSRPKPISPLKERIPKEQPKAVKSIPSPLKPVVLLKKRIPQEQPEKITPPKPKRKSILKSAPPQKKAVHPVLMPERNPSTAKTYTPQPLETKPPPVSKENERKKPSLVDSSDSAHRKIESKAGKEFGPATAIAASPVKMAAEPKPSTHVSRAYPKNKGNPPPEYPFLARRRGWQGTVKLSVLVMENGRVGDIAIAQSSGYPFLDKTALKAVARYRFVPGRQDGRTVATRVLMPVHFRLKDNK